MALITWNDELSVGIKSIDEQHKRLVDIINRFDEAMHKGKGSRIMNEILKDLVGYTQEHFADEEKIMTNADFAGLRTHKAQHRQLLQKIERFQFEFNTEGRRVTGTVQEFLKYWLTSHILQEDKAFAVSQSEEPVPS